MKKTALKLGLVIILFPIIISMVIKFSGKRETQEVLAHPVQDTVGISAAIWQEKVSYTVGDLVGEGGSVYKCLQSHTALEGWEPSKTPALWKLTNEVLPNDDGLEEPNGTEDSDKTEPSDPGVIKGDLPKHILTGYWHNFDNGAECLKISDVPGTYNLIAVAFADATSVPGAVEFNLDPTLSNKVGGYTEDEFIKDIAAANKKNQKVIISVGGEFGAIRVSNDTEATNFANSVIKLIERYGFDGVDIDLENGVNAVYMEKALRQVSDKVGDSLIVAMAPQTLDMQSTETEYFKLAINIKDILTVVNTQFYNSGSMLGEDGQVYAQGTVEFMTALAAIQLENGLRPDQVGLGLPASPKGAGGGYVDPTLVNQALKSLIDGTKAGAYTPVKAYPELRGAMNWSINWDASNGYKFADTVAPVLESLSMNGLTDLVNKNGKAHWAKKDITTLVGKGIISGYTDKTFKPDNQITFSEFLKIAVSSVTEVEEAPEGSHWATGVYKTALDKGILYPNELSTTDFNKPLSREDMALILIRLNENIQGEKSVDTSNTKNKIKDYKNIKSDRTTFVKQAYEKGLLMGNDKGKFNPKRSLTRAGASTVVVRMLDTSARKPLVDEQ